MYIVAASPPTPNGKLHLGHIGGPYLASDVFTRLNRLIGEEVIYISGIDGYLNYVVWQGEKLGLSPEEVVIKYSEEINQCLTGLGIRIDSMHPGNKEKNNFTKQFFTKLINTDAVVVKEYKTLFCQDCNRDLYDSYITGLCPNCVEETKGNICEKCGHPNDPIQLINSHCTIDKKHKVVIKSSKRLVLPLENYRKQIKDFYLNKKECFLRPRVYKLLNELLSKPLPDFPLTYPSNWGNQVEDIPDLAGQIYNSWAEILPGFIYESLNSSNKTIEELWHNRNVKFLEFFGFDNSYFFIMVHLALLFAMGKDHVKYTALISNEFLLLDNKKFSTSRNHAIWATDIIKEYNGDIVRAYLCSISPDNHQSNFSIDNLKNFASYIRENLNKILLDIDQIFASNNYSYDLNDSTVKEELKDKLSRLKVYSSPDNFSLREMAAYMQIYINWATIKVTKLIDMQKEPRLHKIITADAFYILYGLAIIISPIMPTLANNLSTIILKMPLRFKLNLESSQGEIDGSLKEFISKFL
ncbi:class I tRNA ligase family protein [Candidatus Jidaibacter acanthamoebae]|nr:class I tRNA ligase family protein [Candidatus Jidaibacter acanthamoeba]